MHIRAFSTEMLAEHLLRAGSGNRAQVRPCLAPGALGLALAGAQGPALALPAGFAASTS